MHKTYSIILAVLLLLCLAPMPYGYYQLVRFVMMVVFAVMAYRSHEQKQENWSVLFGGLALLFQPFLKISLGRTMWNVVDVVVAGLLLLIGFRILHINGQTGDENHRRHYQPAAELHQREVRPNQERLYRSLRRAHCQPLLCGRGARRGKTNQSATRFGNMGNK